MARNLTSSQITMLQNDNLDARCMVQFVLDTGTYYFCDDLVDITDGTGQVWVGAAALGASVDIVSSQPFASESITIVCDGARIGKTGTDPAALFQQILSLDLTQRRVNMSIGIKYPQQTTFGLVVPMYAGKINNVRVVDQQVDPQNLVAGQATQPSNLEIMLDSLASRYQNVVGRTRSYSDQLQIDPTDLFFQYVGDTLANERDMFWGMNPPNGLVTSNPTASVSYGGVGSIKGIGTMSGY